MSEQTIKRIKSFAWRLGAYVAVSALGFIVDNLAGFGVPQNIIVIVALIVGEITKYLNNKFQLKVD